MPVRAHSGEVWKRRSRAAFALAALLVAQCLSTAHAGEKTTTFKVGWQTEAGKINDAGTIVGMTADKSSSRMRGFIRTADGAIVKFRVPGAAATDPYSINNAGEIAGNIVDANNVFHGFLRAADGTITTFDPPNSVETVVGNINNKGEIAGFYRTDKGLFGYIRAANGTFTSFNGPASFAWTAIHDFTAWINNKGEVAGSFYDSQDPQNGGRGYVRMPDGLVTAFEVPNSNGFNVDGINDKGVVIGYFNSTLDPNVHGFLRAADGSFSYFDPQGSSDTRIYGINNKGAITGQYCLSNSSACLGFVRKPDGTVVTFSGKNDPPAALGASINNKGAVAGAYGTTSDSSRGIVLGK